MLNTLFTWSHLNHTTTPSDKKEVLFFWAKGSSDLPMLTLSRKKQSKDLSWALSSKLSNSSELNRISETILQIWQVVNLIQSTKLHNFLRKMNAYVQLYPGLMMVTGRKLVLETLREIVLTTQILGVIPLGVRLSLHLAHPCVFVLSRKEWCVLPCL